MAERKRPHGDTLWMIAQCSLRGMTRRRTAEKLGVTVQELDRIVREYRGDIVRMRGEILRLEMQRAACMLLDRIRQEAVRGDLATVERAARALAAVRGLLPESTDAEQQVDPEAVIAEIARLSKDIETEP